MNQSHGFLKRNEARTKHCRRDVRLSLSATSVVRGAKQPLHSALLLAGDETGNGRRPDRGWLVPRFDKNGQTPTDDDRC